jgi:hypothetical protein
MWPININVVKNTDNTIAITVSDYRNSTSTEFKSDVVFNENVGHKDYAIHMCCNELSTIIQYYEDENEDIEASAYALIVNGAVIAQNDLDGTDVVFDATTKAQIAEAIKAL